MLKEYYVVCPECGSKRYVIRSEVGSLPMCENDGAFMVRRRANNACTGLAITSAQNEDWLNEKICAACGHSKSRHNTAGGFCKHCTCNEFVELANTASQ